MKGATHYTGEKRVNGENISIVRRMANQTTMSKGQLDSISDGLHKRGCLFHLVFGCFGIFWTKIYCTRHWFSFGCLVL